MKESVGFTVAEHQARRIGSSYSKDPSSLMAFKEGFLKVTLGLRGTWLSSDWLVVKQQSDIPGILIINLLVPTSLGFVCGQHVATILHLGHCLSFSEQLKDMSQIVRYIP